MDEENQNQTEQQDAVEKFAAQQGKKMGRNVANQGLKLLKQAGAHLAKMIAGFVMAHIGPIIIIVAIIVGVGILLPAIEDWIDADNAQTIDEVTYQMVKEYCTIDEEGIHFDKEGFLKNITVELAKNGIDLDSLGLGEDEISLSDSDTLQGNNIATDSEAAEYLYKFVTASLAGELPYIPGSDSETQGIIKIKRKKESDKDAEGNEKPGKDLEYIGYEEFKEKIANADTDEKKDEMMDYFSLDENWNLCIVKPYKRTETYTVNGEAVADRCTSTYTISEVPIPYRTMVSQYTVPFLFLIDLQMVTQNPTYVEAVAELMSKQSEIEFTIFDEITTDDYTYQYTATRNSKWWAYPEDEYGVEDRTQEPYIEGPSSNDVTEVTLIVTQTDKIKANVTKANTWIIKQETKYEMQETIEYPYTEDGKTENPEDAEEPDIVGEWDTGITQYWYEKIVKHEWAKSETNTKILPDKFMGLWSNATGTYVKGSTYLPVGEGKPGKVVKYNVRGTSQEDRPIINIVTAREELYDYLADVPKTQLHSELMQEMIEIYMRGEALEEDTFATSAFTSMYEPDEFIEGSYVGDFDVHDESLFVTNVEELKRAFAGYSNGQRLVDYAQAFLDMQNKYKVNAIFAGAVCVTETGGGKTGNAINAKKNWFNIKDKHGNYVQFENDANSIDEFGSFISGIDNATQKYYPKGNYTVHTIGEIYCPYTEEHPNQDKAWIADVLAQMSVFYAAIGIDIDPMISGGGFTAAGGDGYRGIYTTADGKSYVEYLQFAGPWASNLFYGKPMSSTGCSITSAAVVLSGFGVDINPEDIRSKYPNGVSISKFIESYGISCEVKYANQTNKQEILDHLKTGNPVIINAAGYWTSTDGHYFPVLEALGGNQVYVSNVGNNAKTGAYSIDKVFESNIAVIYVNK